MLLASLLQQTIRFGLVRRFFDKPVSQCVPLRLLPFESVLVMLIICHRRHEELLVPKASSSACQQLHLCPTQGLPVILVPINLASVISNRKGAENLLTPSPTITSNRIRISSYSVVSFSHKWPSNMRNARHLAQLC